ncbi:UNVERIFIED_CONTAM: hypothetical protein FKN15_026452 [Acipenser sinensis]
MVTGNSQSQALVQRVRVWSQQLAKRSLAPPQCTPGVQQPRAGSLRLTNSFLARPQRARAPATTCRVPGARKMVPCTYPICAERMHSCVILAEVRMRSCVVMAELLRMRSAFRCVQTFHFWHRLVHINANAVLKGEHIRMHSCVILAEVLCMRSCVVMAELLRMRSAFRNVQTFNFRRRLAHINANAVLKGECIRMHSCVILAEVLCMHSCVVMAELLRMRSAFRNAQTFNFWRRLAHINANAVLKGERSCVILAEVLRMRSCVVMAAK